MIRLTLVEDQALVRAGLRALLSLAPDMAVVSEAADGVEGLASIARDRPDVVLLDWRMPRLDGLGVLGALADAPYFPPTLILTTFDDDQIVIDGLRAGAKGYLLKDVTLEELQDAIRVVARGGTLLGPALADRLVDGLRGVPSRFVRVPSPEELTERERDVLRLVAGGLSNREVALALDLSEGTVKNYVSVVLAKLGVRDRTRAVLRALELGLI